MIRFEHVSKSYLPRERGSTSVLRGLSLEIQSGETLCLIGASGSGKTTLLRLVNRLLEPSSGCIRVAGQDIAGLEPVALRRRMGYVVQSGALFPHLSVADNIGLLCRLEGWERARIEARVRELLELVHLSHEFAARFPAGLSGGERQRVGVARALALEPEILLLDEPFGALDPLTRAELQDEFLELDRRVAKTVLLVTHDMDVAFRLGDRVALLADGQLAQVGTLEEFRDAPASEHVRAFVRGGFRGA